MKTLEYEGGDECHVIELSFVGVELIGCRWIWTEYHTM